MNTITKTISIFFAMPLLMVFGLIQSMDTPKNGNLVLFMAHPKAQSLAYLPQSKCTKMSPLFPGMELTHLDPFIPLVYLTVSPAQAKTINGSPQDLYTPETAANRVFRQLPHDQKSVGFMPSKVFHKSEDGDYVNAHTIIGAGFTEYRKRCIAAFLKKPLILDANQQRAKEFVRAGIINRDGTHGYNSYFAPTFNEKDL